MRGLQQDARFEPISNRCSISTRFRTDLEPTSNRSQNRFRTDHRFYFESISNPLGLQHCLTGFAGGRAMKMTSLMTTVVRTHGLIQEPGKQGWASASDCFCEKSLDYQNRVILFFASKGGLRQKNRCSSSLKRPVGTFVGYVVVFMTTCPLQGLSGVNWWST